MKRKKKKNSRRPAGWLAIIIAVAVCYGFGVYRKQLPAPPTWDEIAQKITPAAVSPSSLDAGDAERTLAIPAPLTDRSETIVRHTGYTLSYNSDLKIPNWVAWELTRNETNGKVPREDCFAEDPDYRGTQATLADYRGSGYSRGHMAPAADMRWSNRAMKECFYLTNMCPQNASFNSGNWGQLEQQCRAWAKRDSAIIIVCGPIVGRHLKHIGSGKVTVPNGFFKVILAPYGRAPRAIGFIYPHRNKKGARPQEFMTTIDEVERRTGIDFFPSLPDKIEKKIEAQNPAPHWKFSNERKQRK